MLHKGLFDFLFDENIASVETGDRSALARINRTIYRLATRGVAKEEDDINKKHIIQVNLICILIAIINEFTFFLFLFIEDPLPGYICAVSGIVWLLPLHINRNGLRLSSRLLVIFYSAGAIMFSTCWFSHETLLDNYLLILAISCNFMFTYKEIRWQYLSIVVCLFFFIVEATSLEKYLPNYNTIKDLPLGNIVLLIGQILMIFLDVWLYVYFNRLREASLLAKQKELQEFQKVIQVQNEDLRTFSTAASHNMQTPLHVASYFVRKIGSEPAIAISADMKNSLEFVESGLRQIEQLVSGLFSYNKIINIENELESISLVNEIQFIGKGIIGRYPQGAVLVDSQDQTFVTNRMLFSIIIYNLIDNGLKYNRELCPEVRISIIKEDNSVIITVIDNGIGIPERYFNDIFRPFNRVPSELSHKPGNGLGLAGARRAAERIGGRLECIYSNGSGSTFRLEIPGK